MDELIALKSVQNCERLMLRLKRTFNVANLNETIRQVCILNEAGELTDNDARLVLQSLDLMRQSLPDRKTVAQRVPDMAARWKQNNHSRYKPHIRKRMPKERKNDYMQRRRKLAASGYVPPHLAARFTTGQLSVLAVIAQEIGKGGSCSLVIEKIAALAGVCHQTVRRAIALAKSNEIRMINVQYRQRRGQLNLPNVITVISSEWRKWIRNRFKPRQALLKLKEHLLKFPLVGFDVAQKQECNPTQYKSYIKGNRLVADHSIYRILDDIRALQNSTP